MVGQGEVAQIFLVPLFTHPFIPSNTKWAVRIPKEELWEHENDLKTALSDLVELIF